MTGIILIPCQEEKNLTYKEIRKNEEVRAYLKKGNENLGVLGYTDHSEVHCVLVAERAAYILKKLDYTEHDIELAKIAGMMHDIGKLKLSEYLYGRNSGELSVEEMKYMRMHSKISFDVLKNYDYSDNIMKVVLYHHECYDGSGYPDNLKGTDIPLGARILKVTDEFAALISERPYRKAFDIDTAVNILIEEIKNLDMRVFIEFQRMIHEEETFEIIRNSKVDLENLSLKDILSFAD